jgi:hypothetical protein
MTQLYDLCLMLTPPPAGAPAGAIANVELRCDELGFNQPIVLPPLADPFTPAEPEELTWYLETYWQWPYEEFARRGQRVEQLLTEAGQRLYKAVFGSAQAMAVIQPWRLLPDAARQLSIISALPQALSLPWELLCDEQGFLALRTKNPVTKCSRRSQPEPSRWNSCARRRARPCANG